MSLLPTTVGRGPERHAGALPSIDAGRRNGNLMSALGTSSWVLVRAA